MPWLLELFGGESVASSVLILALVAATGLGIGQLRFRGVGLGVAGVLFAGLAFGHLRFTIRPEVLDFTREFGLILFVYGIGQQVGPGFFASLRRQGLGLNLLAAAIVLLGTFTALGLGKLTGTPMPVVVGLLSGASTNTPSLAAAQQALHDLPGISDEVLKQPGLGYAVAYPFGVVGIIAAMVLIRAVSRMRLAEEIDRFNAQGLGAEGRIDSRHFEITNPGLAGVLFGSVPGVGADVVISRLYRDGNLVVPTPDMVFALGDVVLAVGRPNRLEEFQIIAGKESALDLRQLPQADGFEVRRIIATHKQVLGRTVGELSLPQRFGVTVTRLRRGDVEVVPSPAVRIQFGDSLLAVGPPQGVQAAAQEVGDSKRQLNVPQMIPMFIGVALGVLVGSCPLALPGLPAPLKLGLAGGPLIVAILLARLGRLGPINWFMPPSANFFMRELGIALFLACVGLKSGDQFIPTLTHGDGVMWMGLSAAITLLPLLLVGLAARIWGGLNYLPLCGLLAGAMTDPPALAFAHTVTQNDGPALAYATVYPLTMILRVMIAQMIVLLLMA